jgi:NAD(P)-dependent dehydrogenase (short-subunit alcohol dehydrogenase family)
LKSETKNDNIQGVELDLGSFESVKTCAANYKKLNVPLHILILNAGVMACPYGKTKDGFETQVIIVFKFLMNNRLEPIILDIFF